MYNLMIYDLFCYSVIQCGDLCLNEICEKYDMVKCNNNRPDSIVIIA